MKKYMLLIALILFSPAVYAAGYGINIDSDGNIKVLDPASTWNNEIIVDDYNDILSYDNDVLTIKENAQIGEITIARSTTITSNNKEVTIKGQINKKYGIDSNVEIVFDKVVLSEDTGISQIYNFETTIKDPIIRNVQSISSYTGPLNIINSTVYCPRIVSRGDMTIKNSKIYGTSNGIIKVEGNSDTMRIIDSEVEAWNIYTNGSNEHFDFTNSKIHPAEGSDELNITHYMSTTYSIIVKNCDIVASKFGDSSPNKMVIEDSSIVTKRLELSSYTEITNSYIQGTEYSQSTSSSDEYPNPNTIVNNSTIILNGVFNKNSNTLLGKHWTLNNSRFTASGYNIYMYSYGDDKMCLDINDSYFSLEGRLVTSGNINVKNSYFLVNNTYDDTGAFECFDLYYDDSVYPLDINNRKVLLDEPYNEYGERKLIYEDGTIASSIKIVYRVKIVLKVANGTWADGTTEDKIIYKDVWDKLSSSDIPTGMISENGVDGYWSDEISLDDYLKGDLEYTYTFKEVKGVEENPVTGVFKYSFIILFIAGSLIYLYKMIKNKSLFKLN